jgi:hypothetical protein
MSNPDPRILRETILLSAEDRHRMTRLYEEVLTRLDEMAMITARTLGMCAPVESEVLFSPVFPGEIEAFRSVELIRWPQGSGCYDYRQGSCFAHNDISTREERRDEK